MKPIPIYHVDAFTDQLFHGNPAAICVLTDPLTDAQLQAIVAENNLPATVFLQKYQQDYLIRWFTPEESDLCGHGTLAAAFVVFHHLEPQRQSVTFHSSKTGLIVPVQREKQLICYDFPLKTVTAVNEQSLITLFATAFQAPPLSIHAYEKERCLVAFENETQVQAFQPDIALLKTAPYRGIVATARGDDVDFVSRTFYPHKAANATEDAVTGSSHCLLTPYWAEQLNKTHLTAKQVSARGGYLECSLHKDHIQLHATAVLYSQGTIFLR
jgi:PhzF family phenazine biosynthesis protein